MLPRMTADFSHLSRCEPDNTKTVPFPLPYDLGTLLVVSSTESNRAYFNDRFRANRVNRARQQQITSGNINSKLIREVRDEDRVAYSKFVVRGWEGVRDANGNLAPFTQENCQKFLTALPDHLFEEVRDFCRNAANFIEQVVDAEGVAKN